MGGGGHSLSYSYSSKGMIRLFKGGLFLVGALSKFTKWSRLGNIGLMFGQMVAEIQRVSDVIRKNKQNKNIVVQQNTNMLVVLTDTF